MNMEIKQGMVFKRQRFPEGSDAAESHTDGLKENLRSFGKL